MSSTSYYDKSILHYKYFLKLNKLYMFLFTGALTAAILDTTPKTVQNHLYQNGAMHATRRITSGQTAPTKLLRETAATAVVRVKRVPKQRQKRHHPAAKPKRVAKASQRVVKERPNQGQDTPPSKYFV